MSSNGHRPELPKRAQDGDSDEVGIGNLNTPGITFVVLCLRFFTNWRQNVEYGKGADDVKERGSKSEMFVGENLVIELCHCVREQPSPALFPLDPAPKAISLLPQRSSKGGRRRSTRAVSSQKNAATTNTRQRDRLRVCNCGPTSQRRAVSPGNGIAKGRGRRESGLYKTPEFTGC